MMRFAISTSALLLALSACQPIADAETFEVSGEQVISLQGKNLVADPLSALPLDAIDDNLSQSISQTFENQGVDGNDVDSFVAKSVVLEVLGPKDRNGNFLQDLRFLDRVQFTLQGAGLDDALIADSGEGAFAHGVTRLDFEVDSSRNLKDYPAAESMTLVVDAQANDRPALGCDLRFAVTFEVNVNPSGLVDNF